MITAPYMKDSHTSRKAAIEIENRAPSLREQVYTFILEQGSRGATDEEIQIALRMSGNTERPRRRELEMEGRIGIGYYPQTRFTSSGREAVVWFAS
jgi:hypothetical protein